MESLSCKSYKNVKILRATTNTKRPASFAIPIVDPEVLGTTRFVPCQKNTGGGKKSNKNMFVEIIIIIDSTVVSICAVRLVGLIPTTVPGTW